MHVLAETDRLFITEMTMDMAMDVHKNSLDEDTRRFVPDEVFETLEDAQETLEFLMSRYGIRLLENTASGRVQTFFIGAGAYHSGIHEISKSVWKA